MSWPTFAVAGLFAVTACSIVALFTSHAVAPGEVLIIGAATATIAGLVVRVA